MKFKSKIDWCFHLTVFGCLALSIWLLGLFILNKSISAAIIAGVIILLADGLLILPIYFNTYYVLEDTALHIRCGLCLNTRITYKDIKSIKETRNPLASAGLSLDRIQILSYGNEFLISPKNKQEFIKQLNQRIK